jgi:energy-coupling factor transporter ATP-binding protein EcfA2
VVYYASVIKRFYVHNFRCLENFELPISGRSSALLIGNNGSGKTTVGLALEILQRIARGTNRVSDLVKPKDVSRGRVDVPMRFEIEVELRPRNYGYGIAFLVPEGSEELCVLEERLTIDGGAAYTRNQAQVRLARSGKAEEVQFPVDPQLIALPILAQRLTNDPLFVFLKWLALTLILRPIPSLILGGSEEATLFVNPQVTNFGAWFSNVVSYAPYAYAKIDDYLKQVMPDFKEIKKPLAGKGPPSLIVQFANEQGSALIPFVDLSDGEKCFMICAMVLASNDTYGPLLCFWDEPDNYLALSEVGHFVLALRKAFQPGGQFIATSHNPEAIDRFSDENTFHLSRRSHLEPSIIRPLIELRASGEFSGSLTEALIRGDLEP